MRCRPQRIFFYVIIYTKGTDFTLIFFYTLPLSAVGIRGAWGLCASFPGNLWSTHSQKSSIYQLYPLS
jgi:hypothetical protein